MEDREMTLTALPNEDFPDMLEPDMDMNEVEDPGDILNGVDDDEIWYLCGREIPKAQIVFFFQVCVLYAIIITCIINLSVHNGDSNLWTALLSSSLGLMLPGPGFRFKSNKKTIVLDRMNTCSP